MRLTRLEVWAGLLLVSLLAWALLIWAVLAILP